MMRKGGKSIILFIIYLTLATAALGAAPSSVGTFSGGYLARFISMDDGLPGNFVDDIFMDSSGFLWVGTSGGGLCRYDGYKFMTFSTNTPVSIKNNFVRVLAEDGFHRLWIASEGGVDVLDLQTYTPFDLSGTALEQYKDVFCSHLASDSSGCIWAKFDYTLVRISFGVDGSIASVDSFTDPRLWPQNIVFEDVDGDGSMWLGLAGGVSKIVPSAGTLREVPVLEGFSFREDAYLSDFLVREDEVWISTEDGLYRYGLNARSWKHYGYDPLDGGSLSQNFITGLAVSPDKRLVAVSLKGFNVFDPIMDSFEKVASDTHPQMLDSDFINCIKVYGDDIWIGTESAGIVHLLPGRLSVRNEIHDPNDARTLPANPVNALFEDASGRIWVGNVEGGISISDPSGTGFRHLTAANSGLTHNSVSALCADSRGRVWAGTWGGGLNILSANPPYSVEPGPVLEDGTDNRLSYVGSLVMDTVNDLMWIGANTGIYYYDMATGAVGSALSEQTYGCIGSAVDGAGRLWLGSQEGVFVFDLLHRDASAGDCAFPVQNFKYKLDNPSSGTVDKIYNICVASDGTVWLGSYGNGIYKVTEGGDGEFSFHNYSKADGLVNDGVKCILEDSRGLLWISTENGLSVFNPVTERFVSYSVRDGLASSQFYWNAALRSGDGSLLFGNVGGLSIVDPAYSSHEVSLSNLHFTMVTVGDRLSLPSAPESLRLYERDRSIGFEFSSLTYGSGSSVRYSVFMEGQDDGWTELPAGTNFLTYTSMRKGRYVLHVKASDESGTAEEVCSLPINVRPYFYHSWLFYVLMALIAAAAVFAWQERRMKQLVRQREELQATVEERTHEINQQKKLLEKKAEELDRQNKILTRQNEELAGNRILFQQENRPAETRDEKFVSKALDTIRELYKDPDLDVTAFCAAMGMSKTLLNSRLQETLGQSTGQFIRTYRLSIAREILVNNRDTRNMNISEIAYEVGFNDPKYFTRCFTKEFGTAPSSYPQE